MNRLLILLLLVCLAAALPLRAHAAEAAPFTMNGWQFHEYNVPQLEEAVRRAPDYGVNFFIFSHGFFRSVEGFLASTDDADPANPPAWVKELHTPEYFRIRAGWQKDLNHIGDLATAQKIPYYLWVHEFDDVPNRFIKDGRVDMDDPALFPYIEQRYERLLKAVPGTAGFVLTLHECDFKVFRENNVISKDRVPQRIQKVVMTLHKVLARHGKQLILRNFFYEPIEMEYLKEALAGLPDDIIVMSKDMCHEFHPFYPYDPLHGMVGKKKQIIEIDLGVEKAWSGQGAYAQVDYIKRVAMRAQEKGLVGMVGRAHVNRDTFGDVHEVNFYAFQRFMADPSLDPKTVLTDWVKLHYPAEAVADLTNALWRTEYINHHGRWHLEYWFTKSIGAEWGNYTYYFSRIVTRPRYKWSNMEADKKLEEKLLHPDQETFNKLVAEKDEVIRQAKASQADFEKAAKYLKPGQAAPLREDFAFLVDAALLQREWIRAYFAQRMYIDKPSDESKKLMEDGLTQLEKLEKTPGVKYGLNARTGRRYNIDAFAAKMRARVADRPAAIAEDEKILAGGRANSDYAL